LFSAFRSAVKDLVDIPLVRTSFYGHFSVKSRSSIDWNYMQSKLTEDLSTSSPKEVAKAIKKTFFLDLSKPIKIEIVFLYASFFINKF